MGKAFAVPTEVLAHSGKPGTAEQRLEDSGMLDHDTKPPYAVVGISRVLEPVRRCIVRSHARARSFLHVKEPRTAEHAAPDEYPVHTGFSHPAHRLPER